jgi:hypothetical protein
MQPIATYNGQGTLVIDGDTQVAGTFECTQRAGGRIVCDCTLEPVASENAAEVLDKLTGLTEPERFEGETGDGATFEANRLYFTGGTIAASGGASVSFVAQNARVQYPDRPRDAGELRFGLTNLEFEGTETAGSESRLPLTLGGHEMSIRCVDGYADRIKTLTAIKDAVVTAEVVVPIGADYAYPEIDAAIGDLCLLLSIARGCRVQWVYRDFAAPGGQMVERYHRGVSTRPYSAQPLIPAMPPSATRDFVTQTFDKFRDREDEWDLQTAVLIYTEAKQTEDVLVMRGLRAAMLVGFLVGNYQRSRSGDASMKDALAATCQAIRLDASEAEIERFAALHRELMQRARFPEKEVTWHAYNFMLTFAGRVLLAILGYRGVYNDWTRPAGERRATFALKARPTET